MTSEKFTLLAIGVATPATDAAWRASSAIKAIVRQPSRALNGKRFGKRMWGIGLDSFLLALRTLSPSTKGPYLANNPWIAVALRLTGRKNFAVTGLYAEPGSRSWSVLKALIQHAPIITLSRSEAKVWNAEGGDARAVLYGNTFGYPASQNSDDLHIFVGGNSDRDPELIARLENEVLASTAPVRLTVAVGGERSIRTEAGNTIHRTGPVSQQEFGELISSASVVFMPMRSGIRAAGHMVMVGALESGVPVMVTPIEGMTEYVFGSSVVLCDPIQPLLPQLVQFVSAAPSANQTKQFWDGHFSLQRYVERVSGQLAART